MPNAGRARHNTQALAIEMAHRGIVQLTRSAAAKVAKKGSTPSGISAPEGDNPLTRLTDRELEVLQLIVQGANNREIANKLVITAGTVKSHISNILNRLEARDRTQAAVIAVKHGLK